MNLYVRLLKTLILALFSRRRLSALEESRIRFLCWPGDLDANWHMNNGRYLTLMDLGRLDLTLRSGLIRALVKRRWNPVAGGVMIRYRRPLKLFERVELRTRALGWDEKWFYMDQRIYNAEGKLASVALVKALFLGPGGPVVPEEIARAMGHEAGSPELPASVGAWKQSEGVLS
jgi:acyl-CoA thioesterase FadM